MTRQPRRRGEIDEAEEFFPTLLGIGQAGTLSEREPDEPPAIWLPMHRSGSCAGGWRRQPVAPPPAADGVPTAVNRHARRKIPGRRQVYARAIQKVWYHQVPTPEEARELRRNRLPDGSFPLVPLARPAAAAR